jgi:hypothetical protein
MKINFKTIKMRKILLVAYPSHGPQQNLTQISRVVPAGFFKTSSHIQFPSIATIVRGTQKKEKKGKKEPPCKNAVAAVATAVTVHYSI